MYQRYVLSGKHTEIIITDDSLIIEYPNYAKKSSSPRSRIQWFLKQLFIAFLLLLAAVALAYYYLSSVTIECARSSPNSAVICNVTKKKPAWSLILSGLAT